MILWVVCYSKNVQTMFDRSQVSKILWTTIPMLILIMWLVKLNHCCLTLDQVGVNVFLGDEKYFPPNHRGVYHTISNNFFLNEDYVGDPRVLLSVMRHEGWHAAQDCMAGTIDNNFIAIIKPESEVPSTEGTLRRENLSSNGWYHGRNEGWWKFDR